MTSDRYGEGPIYRGLFGGIKFTELMHYQYLPIRMEYASPLPVRIPRRLAFLRPLALAAMRDHGLRSDRRWDVTYVYLTARHGWATPDNPINRPGWHCDGFGTDDTNYVWWEGPGTRFAVQSFDGISDGHEESMRQFEEQIDPQHVITPPQRTLYRLSPYVVHATPIIEAPGCWRSFVKFSFSQHQYNLEGNSHNWLFTYDWKMWPRDAVRNHPIFGEADFSEPI